MSIIFRGTLTHEDSKRHIAHQFVVPAGTTRLLITLDYEPQRAEGTPHTNLISLSLFDPNGARGARHNNPDQTIRLSSAEATPGYVPGPLPAGQWTVYIDTHRIMPPDPLIYTVTVTLSDEPISADPLTYAAGSTAPRGPGWYRGDLHGHTLHSDGRWDVPDFIAMARARGLDFVTLTDHNTVSGLAQWHSLRGDDLLTLGGMELTTYYGHALALGTRQWHEWRVGMGQTMPQLAQAVLSSGAWYVIAHPRSVGDPKCTGCRWEYETMLPGNAPAVEVWNGLWGPKNEAGLQLYYEWLNAGHKLVATTGTDSHGPPPQDASGAALNVVYAEDLSEAAILAGLRSGHSYISSGPDLRLTARSFDDHEAMMGDTLASDGPVHVRATWEHTAPDDELRLLVNGTVATTMPARNADEQRWELDPATVRWFTLEVRQGDALRAVTNPIYLG